jgi:hypothetical protein
MCSFHDTPTPIVYVLLPKYSLIISNYNLLLYYRAKVLLDCVNSADVAEISECGQILYNWVNAVAF